MYIYLDETFNIEKGTSNQFLAIGGFGSHDPSLSAKWYKRLKKKSLPKGNASGEIKSTNAFLSYTFFLIFFREKSKSRV